MWGSQYKITPSGPGWGGGEGLINLKKSCNIWIQPTFRERELFAGFSNGGEEEQEKENHV